ncbi:MAG: TlpA disulfide reductase family protein [Bacteroidota bacterium]
MKFGLIFLFSIGLTLSLCSQTPKEIKTVKDEDYGDYYFDKEDRPVVTGRIKNLPPSEMKGLTIEVSIPLPHQEELFKDTIFVNEDGEFNYQLPYSYPFQQVILVSKDLPQTMINVHEGLTIKWDANKFNLKSEEYILEGVNFSGRDGAMNVYLQAHANYQKELRQELSKKQSALMNSKSSESYNEKRNKLGKIHEAIKALDQDFIQYYSLQNLQKEQGLEDPSQFAWMIHNERKADYLGKILVLNWYNDSLKESEWEEILKFESYSTTYSHFFYSYLSNYLRLRTYEEFIDRDFQQLKSYSKLTPQLSVVLDSLTTFQLKEENGNPIDPTKERKYTGMLWGMMGDTLNPLYFSKTIHYIDSIFPPPKADYLKTYIRRGAVSTEIEDMLIASMETDWTIAVKSKEQRQKKDISQQAEAILDKSVPILNPVAVGTPVEETSFGAQLYHLRDSSGVSFITDLIQAHQGKALLMDLWGTWCRPCIREMPHSKTLQQALKDQPIQFVYLCTARGSDINIWKKAIATQQIPGIHFFVEEPIMKELFDLFSLKGYPSYLFIDRQGTYQEGAITYMRETTEGQLISLVNSE